MDDSYKQGLVTGLAMHPLYVGTIFKKVNSAYFGFAGNDPDGLCDDSSPVGFASAEGVLSEESYSEFLINGSFVDKTGFTGYYDMTSVNENATVWHNLVSGASDITLTNSIMDKRGLTIQAKGYGQVSIANEPYTMYCCFKTTDLTSSSSWQGVFSKGMEKSLEYTGFDFFIYRSNLYHYFATNGSSMNIPSSVKANKYVLMCVTRTRKVDLNDIDNPDDNVTYSPILTVYLNGTQIYQRIENDNSIHLSQWGNYTGKYYLNGMSRGSDITLGHNCPINYKLLAFGNSTHSAEQVKANAEAFFTKLKEE